MLVPSAFGSASVPRLQGAPNYSAPPDFAWQYPLNEAARAYVPYKMGAGPYGDDVHPAYKVPFNALESPPNPYTVAQLPYSAEPYSTYQPQYGEARQGARVPQYNQEAHGYVMFSGNTNEGVNAGSGGPNRMQLREVLQVMNDQSRSNTKHRYPGGMEWDRARGSELLVGQLLNPSACHLPQMGPTLRAGFG